MIAAHEPRVDDCLAALAEPPAKPGKPPALTRPTDLIRRDFDEAPWEPLPAPPGAAPGFPRREARWVLLTDEATREAAGLTALREVLDWAERVGLVIHADADTGEIWLGEVRACP